MQIVIDIPDKVYSYIRQECTVLDDGYDSPINHMVHSILHGVVLPENPTNGDMIKALFPYFEIYDNADNKEYPYVEVVVSKTDSTCYRKSWWNAPYKKEAENEDSN